MCQTFRSHGRCRSTAADVTDAEVAIARLDHEVGGLADSEALLGCCSGRRRCVD